MYSLNNNYMKFIIYFLFICICTIQANAQFVYADPPFSTNPSVSVQYKSQTILPTNGDYPKQYKLKVSITRNDSTVNPIFVIVRENYYRYVFLGKIDETDSSFNYTSEGIGSYAQFIFSPDSSTSTYLLGKNGIYGFSPTIYVQYKSTVSVIVGVDRPFAIYPNPVNQQFVDVQVPGDLPYASSYTRFRIINTATGLVELDIALIELQLDYANITFTNLRNGNYVAQLVNELVNVNRFFPFIISR